MSSLDIFFLLANNLSKGKNYKTNTKFWNFWQVFLEILGQYFEITPENYHRTIVFITGSNSHWKQIINGNFWPISGTFYDFNYPNYLSLSLPFDNAYQTYTTDDGHFLIWQIIAYFLKCCRNECQFLMSCAVELSKIFQSICKS